MTFNPHNNQFFIRNWRQTYWTASDFLLAKNQGEDGGAGISNMSRNQIYSPKMFVFMLLDFSEMMQAFNIPRIL